MIRSYYLAILNLAFLGSCAAQISEKTMFDSETAAIEMTSELGPEWQRLNDPEVIRDDERVKLVRRWSQDSDQDTIRSLDITYLPSSDRIVEIGLAFPLNEGECPPESAQEAIAETLLTWTPDAGQDKLPYVASLMKIGWTPAIGLMNGAVGDNNFAFAVMKGYCAVWVSRPETQIVS